MKLGFQEGIPDLVLKEEIKGERFVYHLRWVIILVETVFCSITALKGRYILPYFAFGFIGIAGGYNLFLFFLFKNNHYRSSIKYFSVLLDSMIISVGLYLMSVITSVLAPVTHTFIYLYMIVLVGSALRLSKPFAVYATLLILVSFNTVYFLRYPAFSRLPFFSNITSSDITGQLFKSLYILFLGFLLYYFIATSQRLIRNVVQSVRASREREERLQKKYEEIINGVNDGIVVSNCERKIVFTNAAFELLTGYSKEDLLGRDFWMLFPEEEIRKQRYGKRKFFRDAPAQGTRTAFESVIQHRDNALIPVEISVSMSNISGENVFLAAIRDIRKRRELERHLIQYYKMETMGKLACGVAHDLNNLLTVVSENIYLAKDETRPDMVKRYLMNNDDVVKKARELIDQILVFSRGGTGVEKNTSLPIILRQIENLIVKSLPPHIKLIIKNRVPEDWIFKINETGIVQVLFNLIINAKDAIAHERGFIEVSAGVEREYSIPHKVMEHSRGRGSQHLVFSVRDTGTGISEAIIDRIFEPCFTTKVDGPVIGNGLGLAIVYTVVESLGGGIGIETAPGRGTTFFISIPVMAGKGEVKKPSPVIQQGDGGGVKQIVFVDDDEDIRLIGKKILEKRGYRVFDAADGEKALSLLNSGEEYDLFIVDYHMPGQDGTKLIEEIVERKDVPIILLTGEISDELEELSSDERIHDIVHKPIDIDEFLMIVKTVVG